MRMRMRRPTTITDTSAFWSLLGGPEGACIRLVLSWTLAGSIAGGGIAVGALTITGVVEPGLELLAAPVLFVVGAFIGTLHGSALAVVGRPACLTRRAALRNAAMAALLATPLLFFAGAVTAAITLTGTLMTRIRVSWLLVAASGWVVGIALCSWAAWEGWNAVRAAVDRWPEGRTGLLGSAILTLSFAATTLLFVHIRPSIVGTGLRVNALGAVGLAVITTFWVALPTMWAALHFVHQDQLQPHIRGGEAGS